MDTLLTVLPCLCSYHAQDPTPCTRPAAPVCATSSPLSRGLHRWAVEGRKGTTNKKNLGVFTIFIIIIIAIIICLYYFGDKLRNHSHKGCTNSIAFYHLCVRGPGDWGAAPEGQGCIPHTFPGLSLIFSMDLSNEWLYLSFSWARFYHSWKKKKSTLSICCQDGAISRQGNTPRWGGAEPRVCDIHGLLPNLFLDSALSMAQHASLWTVSPVISNTPNQSPSSQVFCFPSKT